MAWCKASSLTAAFARTLKAVSYPATRSQVLSVAEGKTVEGWELSLFARQALRSPRYEDLRSVMRELERWLEKQG